MALAQKAFSDLITFTRSSGGGRFNAAGNFEWLPANAPRIDYDPVTGECRGLLIEEQRTNLLKYSSEFGNAAWQKASGVALAADDMLAPDGSVARRVDLVGAGHNIQQSVPALSVGTAYTMSIWVRPKTAPFPVQLAYYDGVTALNAIQTTPSAGTWTRLSYTFTPSSVATSPLIRFIGFGNGVVGDSLYIWGAQLEAGSLSSHIPTTSAQVTRAADVASVNTLAPWFNSAEGTLFVEAVPAAVSGSLIALATLDNGTSQNRIQIRHTGTTGGSGIVLNAGVAQAQFASAADSWPVATQRKAVLSYKQDDFRFAVAGVVLTDSAGSVPAVTRLTLGSGVAVGSLNGHIRSIRYYPRRLSDSELQAMTA